MWLNDGRRALIFRVSSTRRDKRTGQMDGNCSSFILARMMDPPVVFAFCFGLLLARYDTPYCVNVIRALGNRCRPASSASCSLVNVACVLFASTVAPRFGRALERQIALFVFIIIIIIIFFCFMSCPNKKQTLRCRFQWLVNGFITRLFLI